MTPIEYRIERLEQLMSKVIGRTSISMIEYPDFTNGKSFEDQLDVVLLALMIFGEARGEDDIGKAAVAHVVLNRVKEGFGENLNEVILKPKQFSCFNKTDPNRKKMLNLDFSLGEYDECFYIADKVLAGEFPDPTLGATHYWNPKISNPSWAKKMEWKSKIGNHQFAKGK